MSIVQSLSTSTRLWLAGAMLFVVSVSPAQTLSKTQDQDLNALLEKFLTCVSSSADKSQCTSFIGESIAKVYNVSGYVSAKTGKGLTMSEIGKTLNEGGPWKLLGAAYDQKALEEAQTAANAKKAVIAVYKTPDGVGHIALILPGELKFSGTWGFKVPNSASFLYKEPEKSYVNKGLSYAFARTMLKDVSLYSR